MIYKARMLEKLQDSMASVKKVKDNLPPSFDKFLKLDLEKESLDFEVRVVWIVPTRELKAPKKRYDTGMEFVDLKADQGEIIKRYIQNNVSSAAGEKNILSK